jgi:phosphate starvation-inducible PhoH-like protein
MPRKRVYTSDEKILYFEPRTKAQEQAIEVINNNDVTFIVGPAGTGKTHLAVYCALHEMELHNGPRRKQIQKIIITRPIIEAGEKLGALPGEIEDKVHPYMLPIRDCISKMVSDADKFIDDNVEIAPLAYMRGRTFEHCGLRSRRSTELYYRTD